MKRGVTFALIASLSSGVLAVPASVAAPATAAQPAAPRTSIPAAKTNPGNVSIPLVKRVPMSAEGNKILQQYAGSPDPRLQQIQGEIQGLLQQKAQFVTGNPVDVGKLEALLRREVALMSEFRTRQDDRLLQILRSMSESDRIAFLQSRVAVARAPAQGAAGQGAKPATVPSTSARPR